MVQPATRAYTALHLYPHIWSWPTRLYSSTYITKLIGIYLLTLSAGPAGIFTVNQAIPSISRLLCLVLTCAWLDEKASVVRDIAHLLYHDW